MYKVVATLLVLIVLALREWVKIQDEIKDTGPLSITEDTDITVSQGSGVIIDGKLVPLSYIDDVYRWLKCQDKEFPSVYRDLELGKSRLAFLSTLFDLCKFGILDDE